MCFYFITHGIQTKQFFFWQSKNKKEVDKLNYVIVYNPFVMTPRVSPLFTISLQQPLKKRILAQYNNSFTDQIL